MNKKDVSIPMSEATGKSLMIAIPIAIFQAVPFFLIHGFPAISVNANMTVYGFLLLFGILLHELIHMFTWALFAKKPLTAFKLGFLWKALTPYAYSKEPMDIRPYRIGSFAPGLLLGILPWFVSLFTRNFLLFFFGFLPLEEVLFFFVTNLLITFGMTLLLAKESPSRPASIKSLFRRSPDRGSTSLT